MTREELLDRLRTLLPELRRDYPLGRVALFGSWARGDAATDSDVDLMVEVDPAIGLGLVELADRIEEAVGLRVDLATERMLQGRLWPYVEPDLVDV